MPKSALRKGEIVNGPLAANDRLRQRPTREQEIHERQVTLDGPNWQPRRLRFGRHPFNNS